MAANFFGRLIGPGQIIKILPCEYTKIENVKMKIFREILDNTGFDFHHLIIEQIES